jgi:5-methylcytosine-specific restriction endonuclease McrA
VAAEKTCSKCGAAKSPGEFNRDKSKADGRCSRCRECSRQRSSQWYAENTERQNVNRRTYYAENGERERAAMVAWRDANAERKRQIDREWYAANLKRARDARRAWAATNRERIYASNRKRRAVLDRPIAPVRLEDIWERDAGYCQLCDQRIDRSLAYPHPESLTLDHVVPIAAGGRHEPTNVQLAHSLCNLRKGSRSA